MSNLTGLLWPSLFLSSLLGCAAVQADIAPAEPTTTTVALDVSDAGHVALDTPPSPAAAALLPGDARYRVVFADTQEVGLLVTDVHGQIRGRLRIRPLEGDGTRRGVTVLVDDFEGPSARVDAWLTAEGLRGEASVGQRAASWRVHVDADGTLTGQHWSLRHGGPNDALTNLRRARAIGHDIGQLATELDRRGTLGDRRLLELVSLAELSLDLSMRAWERRGCARLPSLVQL